jgi:hypothetical protein
MDGDVALDLVSTSNLGASQALDLVSTSNLGASQALDLVSTSNLGASQALDRVSTSNLGASQALDLVSTSNLGASQALDRVSTSNLGASQALDLVSTSNLVGSLCGIARQEMSSYYDVEQEDFMWLEATQYYAQQVAKLALELDDVQLLNNLKQNIEEDLQSLVQLLGDMDVKVVFT